MPIAGATKIGRGEELLLLTVINHPEILESYFDEFARMQLSSADLDRLHRAIIEIAASESDLDYDRMKHHLSNRSHFDLIQKMGSLTTGALDWFVEREAALEDATRGWLHLLARYKREYLRKELAIAEEIFGKDATRGNLDRLNAARNALQSAEGSEADLDGFGVASGRETGI